MPTWTTPTDAIEGQLITPADWNLHMGTDGNSAYLFNRSARRWIIAYTAGQNPLSIDDVQNTWITNALASATIEHVLPPAVIGMNVNFYVTDAKRLKVRPTTAEYISGLSASQGLQTDDPPATGEMLCLLCLKTSYWYTIGASGTWTAYTP